MTSTLSTRRVVRSGLAFITSSRNSAVYHADWLFLEDVMKARPDLTTRRVDKVLVMKN